MIEPQRLHPKLNASEQLVRDKLERRDFEVLRNGWPDFLVQAPDSGEVFAVEVKNDADQLRPDQQRMHWALAEAGIYTVRAQTIQHDTIVASHHRWELSAFSEFTNAERAALVQIGLFGGNAPPPWRRP